MRLAISDSKKRLHQRSDWHIALRVLPALRDDLAVFIQQQVRKIGIAEFAGQHRGRCLGVQVLRCGASRRGALSNTEHKNESR